MKIILVFGGSGFVGSSLVKHLLSQNHRVIVYIHRNLGYLEGVVDENLFFVKSFEEIVNSELSIDTVYHSASKQPSGSQIYEDFYNSNVELTKDILNLTKKIKAKQLVYLSTNSVFSQLPSSETFNENALPTPSNYYGLTKYIAEKLIEIELKNTDIQATIIRFPSIFGVNSGGGIVDTFYQSCEKNEEIEVYSNGERYRNLIYIDSVVDILYKVFEKRAVLDRFELFMAGSSDSQRLADVAQLLIRLTGSSSKLVLVDKYPPSDFDVIVETDKARELLGFVPLSIEEGLEKYIKDKESEEI